MRFQYTCERARKVRLRVRPARRVLLHEMRPTMRAARCVVLHEMRPTMRAAWCVVLHEMRPTMRATWCVVLRPVRQSRCPFRASYMTLVAMSRVVVGCGVHLYPLAMKVPIRESGMQPLCLPCVGLRHVGLFHVHMILTAVTGSRRCTSVVKEALVAVLTPLFAEKLCTRAGSECAGELRLQEIFRTMCKHTAVAVVALTKGDEIPAQHGLEHRGAAQAHPVASYLAGPFRRHGGDECAFEPWLGFWIKITLCSRRYYWFFFRGSMGPLEMLLLLLGRTPNTCRFLSCSSHTRRHLHMSSIGACKTYVVVTPGHQQHAGGMLIVTNLHTHVNPSSSPNYRCLIYQPDVVAARMYACCATPAHRQSTGASFTNLTW